MQFASRKSSKRFSLFVVTCLTLFALALSACGSENTNNAPTSDAVPSVVAAPSNLMTSGTLTIGTDPTYFPMEYVDQATNQYTGFDIDLSKEIAARLGLKLEIKKTSFDTIFDDLNNKRFDIIVASVFISEERKALFDFVPYMEAGSAILVQKGNPKSIKSLTDLCGLNIGVQNGTSQQKDVEATNEECQKKGKPITIRALGAATEVIDLLVNRRVDATVQGSLSAGYYNKLNPGQFEFGGPVFDAGPSGLVIRKGDAAMLDAIEKAFKAIKDDGTYNKLFEKWGFAEDDKL